MYKGNMQVFIDKAKLYLRKTYGVDLINTTLPLYIMLPSGELRYQESKCIIFSLGCSQTNRHYFVLEDNADFEERFYEFINKELVRHGYEFEGNSKG